MKVNSVAVEGASGAGKTTFIKALQTQLSWPIYRPFRNNIESHDPGADEKYSLARLGIPVNTHVEDLFTADVLQATKANVILDRSMPSALAYDAMGKGLGLGESNRTLALGAWCRRFKAAGGIIIYVDCALSVAVQRSRRFTAEFIAFEQQAIWRNVAMAQELGVRAYFIDTTDSQPVFQSIIDEVLRGT